MNINLDILKKYILIIQDNVSAYDINFFTSVFLFSFFAFFIYESFKYKNNYKNVNELLENRFPIICVGVIISTIITIILSALLGNILSTFTILVSVVLVIIAAPYVPYLKDFIQYKVEMENKAKNIKTKITENSLQIPEGKTIETLTIFDILLMYGYISERQLRKLEYVSIFNAGTMRDNIEELINMNVITKNELEDARALLDHAHLYNELLTLSEFENHKKTLNNMFSQLNQTTSKEREVNFLNETDENNTNKIK